MEIQPEYFDVVGIFTFGVLLYIGIYFRKKEKILSIVLIVIGVLGLIIDVYSIITNFLIK